MLKSFGFTLKKFGVGQMLSQPYRLQAKDYPADGTTWPAQQSKLLQRVTDPAIRQQAGAFFLALLHPDPVQRVTASQSLDLAFLR